MLTLILSHFRKLIVLLPLFISAYSQALTIEENASGFCSYDGAIQNIYPGASNNSYVNISNDAGKGVDWSVQASTAGSYSVSFRYSNAGSESATKAVLRVNGVIVAHSLPFPATASWSSWNTSTPFFINLNSGVNSVRLETSVATEFAMIDSITISGAQLFAAACTASSTPKPPNGGVLSSPSSPALPGIPSPSVGFDTAQSIAGKFEVNSTGQATYYVPIFSAIGSGNYAPQVSVNYNSGASNGLLGVGWSLSAGGSISRCRKTEMQDKNASAITWGVEDRFCLNGSRLLVVSGDAYGLPNSQYRTEIESFTQITAIGGSVGDPDYFKVEYKNGHIEFYGIGDSKHKLSSTKTLRWMLSSSEDSAGNKIIYRYINDSYLETPLLESIDYAYGSAGVNPAAVITFEWELRSDRVHQYISGELTKSSYRLSEIHSKNNDLTLRRYILNYNQGDALTAQDKLSRLSSISECSDSNCRSATNFKWTLPIVDGFIPDSGNFIHSSAYPYGEKFKTYAFADINGDGLQDIAWMEGGTQVYYALASIANNGKFTYSIANYDGGGSVHLNYYPNTSVGPTLYFTDYNHDGRADLILQESPSQQLRVYLSKPQQNGSWLLSSTPELVIPFVGGLHGFSLADLNGDGLEDLFVFSTQKVRYMQV